MVDRRLQRQLDEVALRYRRMRAATWLAIVWIVLATVAAILFSLNRSVGFYIPGEAVAFAAIGCVATFVVWVLSWRAARDPHWIARRIEDKYPQLQARLLTAIEQRPELPEGRYGYLQTQVIQEAVFHGYRHDWRYVLSSRAYAFAVLACLLSCGAIVLATVGLFRYLEPAPFRLAPLLGLDRSATTPLSTRLVSVDPGDASIEKGTSLLILAKFEGHLPLDCVLELIDQTNTDERQISMKQSLEDPVFGGRIPAVDEELAYRIRYGNQRSQEYRVTVFEYPALQTADAVLDFPDYTSLETKTVQDVRHVSAVEGTRLTLLCHLNKPVARATLEEDGGESLRLEPDPADPATCTITLPLTQSRRLHLQLEDDAGRTNKQPPEFVLTVTPNRRPSLELAFPSRDVEVSPIEELQLAARLWDDYGLSRYGLTYQLGTGDEQEVTLGTSTITREKLPVDHVLEFEKLQAKPNQLLTYHFWAEDMVVDGASRRTMSDMFFAEVRPFDEIYRQGEQPPGGSEQQQQQPGQGQGQQAGGNQVQQLAEQQKEIMNATWNILRREGSQNVSPEFQEDVAVVRDAQSNLRDQVSELAQRIEDAQAQQHISTLTGHMAQAVAELTRATDESLLTPLETALKAEQAAYQTLLQLRAREHEVIRSNMQNAQQARSQSNSSSRSQRQLQQLALSNQSNRYETERQAAPQEQQNAADRESRQILNRLRELARRQNDLNERLQELQSALEQATDEQEREELLKQLKRLREQQQEILRDTDELNSRMHESDAQQNMRESQQRLQQARENVRRSSEALEEGRISQALSSGTRAQSQLDELRDEFRKRTSDQFQEEARDLKRQANELAQTQRELAEKLNEPTEKDADEPRSLRDPSRREEVLDQLAQQNQRLNNLLEQMQETVREAEEPQPLLAEQLYDSFRQARQDRVPERLRETQRSLQRGLVEDSRQLEALARQGIEQLRDSIERAAESVLGDENEALRRAREELDQLAQELNDEIQRANPQQQDGAARSADNQQSPEQNRSGQPQAERDQQGQQQRGQQQQGQQQQGQQQQGQQQQGQQQQGSRPGQRRGGDPSDRRGEGMRQPGATRLGPDSTRRLRANNTDGLRAGGPGGGNEEYLGPLTGRDFRDWADRLGEVEEMISDPDLKSDAARIRDRAKEVRSDLIRHSQQPNWELVRMSIAEPLNELRDRIGEELQKRVSNKSLVPIDRDPVPRPYAEQVRRYYERIGSGE